ncbi:MAG TPA: hypothetical protein VMB51_12160 [Solirubrobacteraceae bacterium]|nr:hypothetical protein [Solirubrobacteraceae bacterium]
MFDAGPELKQSDTVRDSLWAWSERAAAASTDMLVVKDMEVEEDAGLQPFRLMMTVAWEIEAPSEWDARSDAASWFRERCEQDRLPEAESVVANAAD